VYLDDAEVSMEGPSLRARQQRLAQRRAWHHKCLLNDEDLSHAPHPVHTFTQREDEMRHHAFMVWHHTAALRPTTPTNVHDILPSGVERWWIHTFARPVRRVMQRSTYEAFAAERPYWKLLPAAAPGVSTAVPLGYDEVAVEEPFDFAFFAPFVPIFVAWEALFEQHHGNGIPLASHAVINLIDPKFQYVTVTQRHSGWYLQEVEHFRAVLRHVMVLSAGGRGHVALPLLLREQPLAFTPPFGQRVGTRELVVEHSAAALPPGKFAHAMVREGEWQAGMALSAYQLAPRGVGPTSFRLYEVLQMGLVPIYVWSDTRWLPYAPYVSAADAEAAAAAAAQVARTADSREERRAALVPPTGSAMWDEIAFVVRAEDYPAFIKELAADLLENGELYERKRAAVRKYRDAYFTYPGVMAHIRALFDDPDTSELRCVRKTAYEGHAQQ
jgi:hypothetical protein